MSHNFFAFIYRMRYISRWGLMKNLSNESLAEHSGDCAIIAHALAVISKNVFGKNIDANECMAVAIFHDASEIITGDMPTPIKYFNKEISEVYKDIEKNANKKLLEMLPKEILPNYSNLILNENAEIKKLVKWADKICAYTKCLEELKSGNLEFKKAEEQIGEKLKNSDCEEVLYFLDKFMPAFSKSLDELE